MRYFQTILGGALFCAALVLIFSLTDKTSQIVTQMEDLYLNEEQIYTIEDADDGFVSRQELIAVAMMNRVYTIDINGVDYESDCDCVEIIAAITAGTYKKEYIFDDDKSIIKICYRAVP